MIVNRDKLERVKFLSRVTKKKFITLTIVFNQPFTVARAKQLAADEEQTEQVEAELKRIPCYKSLYDKTLFKTVQFKNKRIYWNDQCDFHLDQILARGHRLSHQESSDLINQHPESRSLAAQNTNRADLTISIESDPFELDSFELL